MEEKLADLLDKLNKELLIHPLIKEVKEAEKAMEDNEEFIHKVMILEQISTEYNDAVRFKLPLEKLQKKLFEAKYQLDTLNVVKEYRQKYKKAQEYLNTVSKLIFANISSKLKINELL